MFGSTYSGIDAVNDNVPLRDGVTFDSSSFLHDMMHKDAAIANIRVFSLRYLISGSFNRIILQI